MVSCLFQKLPGAREGARAAQAGGRCVGFETVPRFPCFFCYFLFFFTKKKWVFTKKTKTFLENQSPWNVEIDLTMSDSQAS